MQVRHIFRVALGVLVSVALQLSVGQARAELSDDESIGTNLVRAEYDELNWLNGRVWVKAGIAENYGELLDEKSEFRAIARTLFRRVGGYQPSGSPTAEQLTPFRIGQWLGILELHAEKLTRDPSLHVVNRLVSNLELERNHSFQLLSDSEKEQELARAVRLAYRAIEHAFDSRVYRLFLAFLSQKANSTNDIARYHEGLRDVLAGDADRFLYRAAPPRADVGDLDDNYDRYLADFFRAESDMMPTIQYFGKSMLANGQLFSNCGEMALLNFLRLVIDRGGNVAREHQYAVDVLRELGAEARVVAFFDTEFPTRASQLANRTRDESYHDPMYPPDVWAEIVSNRTGVDYRQSHAGTRFNISAGSRGAENMIALINALFPHARRPVANWSELALRISEARLKVGGFDAGLTIDLSGLRESRYGRIRFELGLWQFWWDFEYRHFVVQPSLHAGIASIPPPVGDAIERAPIFAKQSSRLARRLDLSAFAARESRRELLASVPAFAEHVALYALLRDDDSIVEYLADLPADAPVTVRVGLLNRLMLEDARFRAFRTIAKEHTAKVLKNKYLVVRQGYLEAAIDREDWPAAHTLTTSDELRNPAVRHYLFGQTGAITSAEFSSDGRSLVIAASDGTTRTWDAASGALLHSINVGTRGDNSEPRKMATKMLEQLRSADIVSQLTWNCDQSLALTESKTAGAALWEAESGAILHRFEGQDSLVYECAFSANGSHFLRTNKGGRRTEVWDVTTGKQVSLLQGRQGAFSSDGAYVVTSDKDALKICSTETGALIQSLETYGAFTNAFVVSRDGKRFAASSTNEPIVAVWDAESGQLLHKLKGHWGAVTMIRLSNDGHQVMTASDDKTVRIWEAR